MTRQKSWLVAISLLRYAKSGAFDLDDLNILPVPLLNETAPAG